MNCDVPISGTLVITQVQSAGAGGLFPNFGGGGRINKQHGRNNY